MEVTGAGAWRLGSGRYAATALFAIAALLCSTSPSAQSGAPSASVAIDFFAVGADGPVFDLRADELTLKVDGRTRPIRSLRYVAFPTPDPVGSVVDPRPPLEPPYGTNLAEDVGRWVAIVVDDESIRPGAEKNVMNGAVRLVNSLSPRDQVSYITMPHGGLEVPFTDDRQKIVAALRRFLGRGSRETSEQDRSCRSRLVLNGMRDLLRSMAPLEGPKVVVLLSSGLLNPRRDAALTAPPGPCEIRVDDFQEVRNAAALARGYVYVAQPDDLHVESALSSLTDRTLSRFSAADKDRAGLESLAGATAGEFFRIVGPDDQSLPRIARDTAGYYVATFDPEDRERNGFAHRVDLGVGRDGVRVRTRPDVVIPRPGPSRSSSDVKTMLRAHALYRALPLRVVAYTSAGEGDKVKVMAVVEPVERGVRLASAVFGLFDSRDQLTAQWTANNRELANVPLVTAGEATPGPYRLRVAAIDTTGRQGSAEYGLLARLSDANPVTLSSMAVGTSRDGSFMPKLLFGTDQAAVVYFEIYGKVPPPGQVTVRLEVAEGPEDRALGSSSPRIVTPSEDRRLIIGAIPIAPLPPGDYTMRAIVSLDGRPVGRIYRTIRKAAG